MPTPSSGTKTDDFEMLNCGSSCASTMSKALLLEKLLRQEVGVHGDGSCHSSAVSKSLHTSKDEIITRVKVAMKGKYMDDCKRIMRLTDREHVALRDDASW
jgi:hypothetical protein